MLNARLILNTLKSVPDMICYREAQSDIASVDDVYNMCFLVTAIKKTAK